MSFLVGITVFTFPYLKTRKPNVKLTGHRKCAWKRTNGFHKQRIGHFYIPTHHCHSTRKDQNHLTQRSAHGGEGGDSKAQKTLSATQWPRCRKTPPASTRSGARLCASVHPVLWMAQHFQNFSFFGILWRGMHILPPCC